MNGLCWIGSLRKDAFGRKLAAAVVAASETISFECIDGRDLPLYDQDLDGDEKPVAVRTLLDQVSAAGAMVFVTPEYNYGIPGPLKNAIDWASRPAYNSPLKGKPALVISYSISPTGGVRAHQQLDSVLAGTLTPVFVAPSFVVPAVHEKFDADGVLTDEQTKVRLERSLADFADWAARI